MNGSDSHILRIVPIVVLAWITAWAAGSQSHPPGPHHHPEAQRIKNPIPSDPASIEAGRRSYGRHCASCHGPTGKGDGSMALAGGTPANLIDETWDHGSTDGEIFIVIKEGTSNDMEPYKEKLTEKEIWHVINYIRSMGSKK